MKDNKATTALYPNIILIVIDALRARNLGCYGMDGNPSPNIDLVAQQQGILFENSYCCWNTTDQSLTSILTGKYPRSHGIINHGDKVTQDNLAVFQKTNTKLLAQILQQHGYNTMAVDWMGRWFNQGFDYYGYELERNLTQKISYYAFELPKLYLQYMLGHLPILKCYTPIRKPAIKDMVKGIKDVLSTFAFTINLAKLQDAGFVTNVANGLIEHNQNKPFFLFLHYWDTHTPYHCPREYIHNEKQIHDSKTLLIEKYNGAVTYVDYQLGKLFEVLKQKNLWNNTLLIITSDHGDSLTEHDIFFDHHGLYDETTHVPLIIHYPRLFEEAKRISGFVQHIDLAPTICDILNITETDFHFDGQSLLPLGQDKIEKIKDHVFIEESYVQRKTAIRTNRYKYIMALDNDGWCNYCQKVHVGKEELYDLNEDPTESHDIAKQSKSLAESMKKQLMAVVKKLDEKRENIISKSEKVVDEENKELDLEDELIKKRLKSLGYL